jgi:hypothetical protein
METETKMKMKTLTEMEIVRFGSVRLGYDRFGISWFGALNL